MLIQLKKCNHPIEERIKILEKFINQCVQKIIREVEASSQYENVKEQLSVQLHEMQQQQEQSVSNLGDGTNMGEREAPDMTSDVPIAVTHYTVCS